MIDVENAVFDYVYTSVSQFVPEGCFRSTYVPSPTKFPFATLMEIDNQTDESLRGTAVDEEYAVVTYEANVYAEDKAGCRRVMDVLDRAMIRLGFMRLSLSFIPNLADSTLFRCTGRYRAAADANNIIYRHS